MSRDGIARSARSVCATIIRLALSAIFLAPLYIAIAEAVWWLKSGAWPHWTLRVAHAILPVEAWQWVLKPADWFGLHAVVLYLVRLTLSLFAVVCYVTILILVVVVVMMFSGGRKSTHVTRYG
jgi:hypothetical protein